MAILMISSLVASLAWAAPQLDSAIPFRPGIGGLTRLFGGWLIFGGWGLLYAVLLQRTTRASWERSLYLAALCHTPLLLSLGLLPAIYGDRAASDSYLHTSYGQLLFQTIVADCLLLAPAMGQLAILLIHRRKLLLHHLPLIAVVAIGARLRLSHLAWGLPGLLHPDEARYYGPATIMAARGDLNPHYFQNPSLMIYLTYVVLLLLAPQARAFHAADGLFQLGIADPRGDFLDMVVLRAIVGVTGALTLILVYLAGRELLSRRASVAGACLLAVAFLHVRNSHYATNDVLATCLLTASFLFSARIYTRGRVIDYMLAGVLGGLATSTKYNVGLFAVATLAAHLARTSKLRAWCRAWRHHLLLALAASVSLVAFLMGTPYALLDFRSFAADFQSQWGYGSERWIGQKEEPTAQLFLATLMWGLGLLPTALAVLGAALMSRRRPTAILLLLSVPAAYFAFISAQRLFFARFALPMLPFLCLLAGYAIEQLGQWRLGRLPSAALTITLLLAAALQPLALSLRHEALLGSADTRLLAAKWIDSHLPANASIAIESDALLDPKFGWKGYEGRQSWVFWPENADERAKAISGEFEFVVVSSFGYGPWQPNGEPPSSLPAPYSSLEKTGRLVAIFAPGFGNSEITYALDDMYTPFWHLFDRERPGPTVRIYQLRSTGGGP